MKKKICKYLSDVLVGMSEDELLKTMEIPPERLFVWTILLLILQRIFM